MTSAWKTSVFTRLRNVVRLTLWLCLAICLLMMSVFLVLFTFETCCHLWDYFLRTIFARDW